jgi:hypothetical protein
MTYQITSLTDWVRSMELGGELRETRQQATRDTMFTATEDFVADYDGARLEIVAGRHRFAPGHEIVRRFPDRFREIDVAGGPGVRDLFMDQRTRTAQPIRVVDSTNPSLEPWLAAPEIHSSRAPLAAAPTDEPAYPEDTPPIVEPRPQPFEIAFSSRALRTMRECLNVARDGREWGGWLFGALRPSFERRIGVAFATGGGPKADRGEFHLELDTEWREDFDSGDSAAGTWIGNFHTHAAEHGPSPSDLRTWESRFEILEGKSFAASRYVAIIGYPNADSDGPSWAKSHLRGYVLRREDSYRRRIVVEPAQIVEVN